MNRFQSPEGGRLGLQLKYINLTPHVINCFSPPKGAG